MKTTKILLLIGLIFFISACKDVDDMHHEDEHYDTSQDASSDPYHQPMETASDSEKFVSGPQEDESAL